MGVGASAVRELTLAGEHTLDAGERIELLMCNHLYITVQDPRRIASGVSGAIERFGGHLGTVDLQRMDSDGYKFYAVMDDCPMMTLECHGAVECHGPLNRTCFIPQR